MAKDIRKLAECEQNINNNKTTKELKTWIIGVLC